MQRWIQQPERDGHVPGCGKYRHEVTALRMPQGVERSGLGVRGVSRQHGTHQVDPVAYEMVLGAAQSDAFGAKVPG